MSVEGGTATGTTAGGDEPARHRPRRRRAAEALRELHFTLRTEGESPGRLAAAVALGTFIGCIPVYGAHLALCIVLGKLLGLNRVTTYLAAHVNNPITAPFLLYGELWVGRAALSEAPPTPGVVFSGDVSILDLGAALFVGAAVVGVALGLVLGATTWFVVGSVRRRFDAEPLRERVCDRYRSSGILHWEFVRGKLWHDPLYGWLVASGTLPERGRVLDLGCGRGIVLALVASAREGEGAADLDLVGVEHSPRTAEVARRALGEAATIQVADLCDHRVERADAVLLLDVLHYLPADCQERLIGEIAESLEPGGMLLLREPDAAGGWRFAMTRLAERFNSLARRAWHQRFCYRTLGDWRRLCDDHGLRTETFAVSEGTPFANVVVQAVKAAEAGTGRSSSSE